MTFRSRKILPNCRSHSSGGDRSIGRGVRPRCSRCRVGQKPANVTRVMDLTSVSQHGEDRVVATRGRRRASVDVGGLGHGHGCRCRRASRVRGVVVDIGLDGGMDLAMERRRSGVAATRTRWTTVAKDELAGVRAEAGPSRTILPGKLGEDMGFETCSSLGTGTAWRPAAGLRGSERGDGRQRGIYGEVTFVGRVMRIVRVIIGTVIRAVVEGITVTKVVHRSVRRKRIPRRDVGPVNITTCSWRTSRGARCLPRDTLLAIINSSSSFK